MDKKNLKLIVGSVIAIVIGTFIYDRISQNRKPPLPPYPPAPNPNGNGGGGGNNNSVNYSPYAYALYEAMDGWGTDEDAVLEIANMQEAPQIAQWFDQNKLLFEGYTLKEWIEGDFSGNEESQLLNKFGY
tara:strand:- start:26991 stop:27380 length:390 start_codon:yes stop_codon:yes gene_type:complete